MYLFGPFLIMFFAPMFLTSLATSRCRGNPDALGIRVESEGKRNPVLTFDGSIFAQTWNASVADKNWADLGVAAFGRRRQFEIEDANAPTLFSIIGAAVA